MKRVILIVMLVLNLLVLLGQLWPAGAPPFAAVVNIAFLLLTLILIVYLLVKQRK
ncbi:hypothetical protein SDC9_14844 [bioreactor metagenome]|jgi:hypothetical protein|uniref:Uncharacterized protein n=1 Tax=bioreactor metagenome TaxID=1076179 RepID=A0A644TTU3_9ZZZZ|nr:hypothetical protein [Lentimicrobium sp.]MEA5108913.1 hypothetical protein [Lentimicrobium sp.]